MNKDIKDKVTSDNQHELQSEEIDYSLVTSGPLYVDSRHKKPGYEYCFAADRPGEIEMYKRWGYSVVIDEFSVGDVTPSTSTRFGSAVTVQSKCGTLLVLMAITESNHSKLMAYRDSLSKARQSSLGKIDGVPEQYQQFNGQSLNTYKITKS